MNTEQQQNVNGYFVVFVCRNVTYDYFSNLELLFVYATDDPTAFATKHLASLIQNTQATLRRQGGPFVFYSLISALNGWLQLDH